MSPQMLVAALCLVLLALILASVLSALIGIRHGDQLRLQTEALRALNDRLRSTEILLYDLGYRPRNGLWERPASSSPFDAIDPGASNV